MNSSRNSSSWNEVYLQVALQAIEQKKEKYLKPIGMIKRLAKVILTIVLLPLVFVELPYYGIRWIITGEPVIWRGTSEQ